VGGPTPPCFPPVRLARVATKILRGFFTHTHTPLHPPKTQCVSRTQSALKVQAPHGVSNSRHHVHTPLHIERRNTNPKNLMCFSHTKCAQSSGTTWRVKLTPSRTHPIFYSEHNNTIADNKTQNTQNTHTKNTQNTQSTTHMHKL